MITLKKIDEAMETYKDLDLLLAQCRSTIHELATVGKRQYERAERAERKLAEAEAKLKAIRVGYTKTVAYDLSPAMVEGTLREQLEKLGWKFEPPTENNSGKRLLDQLAVPPDER